jgi:hypothetical protein
MKRPELLIQNGECAGRRFPVKEGGMRLGRSSSNDIHMPDEELSRNHCIFEVGKGDAVRIIDLASANGTFVNGVQLGSEPRELHPGDVIEVGSTRILVVTDEPETPLCADAVDLGLESGTTRRAAAESGDGRKRRSTANVLWAVAIVTLGAATAAILLVPSKKESAFSPVTLQDRAPEVQEVYYEKVEADTSGIFRYELTLSADGTLRVSVDDVPDADRHLVKSGKLSDDGLAGIRAILAFDELRTLNREYFGFGSDTGSLKSWRLKVVYSDRVHTVSVVNTQEPETFRAVRERLETFSKNELGIWAIQYSRDRLVELSEESLRLARQKREDRDVEHGNLFAAISAYREVMFYLETVDPKPEFYTEARGELKASEEELASRYRDQRFRADRALNLGEWTVAKKELSVLMEMIPDRDDERYREAKAKLLDVDKRTKDEGGRR